MRTAWLLGNRPALEELKLRRYVHQVGFGGHWHTKSRRFSTTFGALRRARPEHVRRSRATEGVALDAWGRPEDEEAVVVIREWRVTGFGYQSEGEMALALSAAARARERRQAVR
ncbi:MAG: replication initiator, partial [Actinomycetota bacterium]